MSVKELLLVLNLKAESSKNQYVLQYNYSFNTNNKRIYNRVDILKYYNGKMINKIKVWNEAGAIDYITKEMQLYAQ